MSVPKPTLVISSIGVSPTPINVTIISGIEPITRDNGGDLQNGDRWFENTRGLEHIYDNGVWRQIATININN